MQTIFLGGACVVLAVWGVGNVSAAPVLHAASAGAPHIAALLLFVAMIIGPERARDAQEHEDAPSV